MPTNWQALWHMASTYAYQLVDAMAQAINTCLPIGKRYGTGHQHMPTDWRVVKLQDFFVMIHP